MPITIEQIKRLNAERTQGKWGAVQDKIWCVGDTKESIGCVGNIYGSLSMHGANIAFIAAAPAIAELAIKQAEALEQIANFDNWRKDINFEGKEVWMWLGKDSVLTVAMKALGKDLPVDLSEFKQPPTNGE